MASLVAYDGSGSESEDDLMTDTSDEASQRNSSLIRTSTSGGSAQRGNGGATVRNIKLSTTYSKFMDHDDDRDGLEESIDSNDKSEDSPHDETKHAWSTFLPQPKKTEATKPEFAEEIGPIPPKKTYGDEEMPPLKSTPLDSLTTSKVRGKVLISIPFLNSLEDGGEDKQDKRRIIEPSKKGSGLFAMLPQPKFDNLSSFVKSKQPEPGPSSSVNSSPAPQPTASGSMAKLIPDSVKNNLKRPAQTKIDEIRAKYSKKEVSLTSKKTGKDSDDSDDEDAGGFFSFSNEIPVDAEALEKLKLPMPCFENKPAVPEVESMDIEESEDGFQQQPTSSTSRREDLMQFIRPKRGKKEDVNIIDISADDLRPDNTEWLKNITDESAVPARRSKGPGGMVKRKHQITYLAFEAKAREQELKNQWAQNRANKMATQNKYGF